MPEQFTDPWVDTLSGPWRKEFELASRPCHYGCGHLAAMTEPGKTWKAHKVCALGVAGQQTAVIDWDGEDRESKAKPRALGCGTPEPEQVSGRTCAGTGAEPSCQLCPQSPNYWRRAGDSRG